MRFVVLLLLFVMLPVHVLAAGSYSLAPAHGDMRGQADQAIFQVASPEVTMDVGTQDGQGIVVDRVDQVHTVFQGDLDETPLPGMPATSQVMRAAFMRPAIRPVALHCIPGDVFRPPRTA